MKAIAKKVIGIAVGLLIAATIVPSALVAIANATLSGVDPSVVMVFSILLPILAVIAIAMAFMD